MFLLTIIFINVIGVIIIKLYIKLTTGICKSSKHLVGKVVIVTGSNKGIGYETAKNLAERGARVILACRDKIKGVEACKSIIEFTGNNDVFYKKLDLASLASVRTFADDILKTEKRIDILINNAGVLEVDNIKTQDGLSLAMQSNYFGPFLLTNLLLPLIKKSAPSRIINVSSLAYMKGKIDFDNINNENDTDGIYGRVKVYINTKLCNILMTMELARRLEGTNVTTNCLHPGVVATDILLKMNKSWLKFIMPLAQYFFKTPWEGAQTTIYLAVSPEVDGVTGKYYSDCREVKLLDKARDEVVSRKLWEVSEKLVGLKD